MPFVKGKSGNPGGRPKEDNEVKELARAFTAEAVERLGYWMRSDDPRASVPASTALLDRAYGKPAQTTNLTVEDKREATDWTRAELVSFLADATSGGDRASEETGRQRKPGRVY